jgi:GAF domain-containing protein
VAEHDDLQRELDEARATIAGQAVQIHRLEASAEGTSGAQALREMLQLSDIVSTTVGEASLRSMLEGLLAAACNQFGAEASSILTVDHATNELVFVAAHGGADVVGLRIPAHRGIAGWALMTGEPIISGDVRRDPHWAKDFAEKVGYIPRCILAVPLLIGEDALGVMELLDKRNNATFTMDDLDGATLYARPAAIAVQQAQRGSSIGRMLAQELHRLAVQEGDRAVADATETVLAEEEAGADAGAIELARIVHRLARRGDRATTMAAEILTAVEKYATT